VLLDRRDFVNPHATTVSGNGRCARLERAVDSIRDRFGNKAIRRAALVRKNG